MKKNITSTIEYIGVDDKSIDLFESQYIVPNGISYNSYIIKDEKTAVMDTVDTRKADEWLANLKSALNGKAPDYLVISHVEPDHAGCVELFTRTYPDAKLIGNAKTFTMIKQFFNEIELTDKTVTVKEGDTVSLGSHTLTFIMAPMIHWPEVMVTYESSEKVLFSADAFGKFGAIDTNEDWDCEARRYYINIVGKYGVQVQTLLKKAAALDIQIICPLHGPVLSENLGHYIEKYNIWSSYAPENKGIFIAYASIHGNTGKAAEQLAEILKSKTNDKVSVADLARDDMAECVEDAFRYDRIVVASATYDGGLFPCMESFIAHLKAKNYQNRTVGLIENGTWAATAAKKMKAEFEGMKNISICENIVSIKSTLNEASRAELVKLADELVSK